MSYTKSLIALSTLVLLLGSCASGSVVLTGQARQPVSAAAVKLYTQAPAEYEVIGLVKASSEMGWTDQGSIEYAIEELKKQAGKLGANGVLIDSMSEKAGTASGSFVANPGGGGVFIYQSDSTQVVSGKAIYVTREK